MSPALEAALVEFVKALTSIVKTAEQEIKDSKK